MNFVASYARVSVAYYIDQSPICQDSTWNKNSFYADNWPDHNFYTLSIPASLY